MLAHAIVLFAAALVGGALNAVAGGGSFLTFPALIFTGMAAIPANATSTVALWPGSVASIGAYRREVRTVTHLALLSVVSVVGGVLGALLLLHLSSSTFQRLIPYLLLAATLIFAFNEPITRRLRRGDDPMMGATSRQGRAALALTQFVIALYGGFFGGGIGILMLATLGVMGMDDIHAMNGLKTVLATLINGVAVLTFIVARAVRWPEALLMLVGAIIGGYAGAAGARRLDQRVVRWLVIAVGAAMTGYFFLHG